MENINIEKERYYEQIYKAAEENKREEFRELFLELHDRDQHEVFHLLYPEKKKKISEFLSAKEFSEIFEYMALEDQEAAVRNMPQTFIAEVLNYLPADEVAEFLTDSNEVDGRKLLNMMDDEESKHVQELLSYAPETAGSIMTKEFISVEYKQTTTEVIAKLRRIGREAETIYYLYVVNELNKLVGVLSLRDLLLSPEDAIVEDVMFSQVVGVRVDEDQEVVARLAQDYDLLAVPVTDFSGVMLGIVTVDDILDILEEETTEDFNEFAAISKSEDDRKAPTALSAAKSRIPWIVVLLFLGMLTGGLIGIFEETLNQVVMLATFIPIMMATAGNVGTQSLAVAVRNLTLDDEESKQTIFKTIKNELGAGIIMGVVAAIVMSIVVMVLYRNPVLAFVIAVSMLITVSLSTVIGTIIPAIISKFKIDPAVASGPFITTINDSISLVIYFSIATLLIGQL